MDNISDIGAMNEKLSTSTTTTIESLPEATAIPVQNTEFTRGCGSEELKIAKRPSLEAQSSMTRSPSTPANQAVSKSLINTNVQSHIAIPSVQDRGIPTTEAPVVFEQEQEVLFKQLEHYSILIKNLLKEVDEAQYKITFKSRLRMKGGIADLHEGERRELEKMWGWTALQSAEQRLDSLLEGWEDLPRINRFTASATSANRATSTTYGTETRPRFRMDSFAGDNDSDSWPSLFDENEQETDTAVRPYSANTIGQGRESSTPGILQPKDENPLPATNIENPNSTVAVKRARNTAAARKSRAKKDVSSGYVSDADGDNLDNLDEFKADKNNGLPTTCTNSFKQITPLWRRDSEGDLLCNACGLFLESHGVNRPLSLKTDVAEKKKKMKKGKKTGYGSTGKRKQELSDSDGTPPKEAASDSRDLDVPAERHVKEPLSSFIESNEILLQESDAMEDFDLGTKTSATIRSTDTQFEAKSEALFIGLEGCLVVRGGEIEDKHGKCVGILVDGRIEELVGRAVREDGCIVDEHGNIVGHAEPFERPEEEAANTPTSLRIFTEHAGTRSHSPLRRAMEYDYAVRRRPRGASIEAPNIRRPLSMIVPTSSARISRPIITSAIERPPSPVTATRRDRRNESSDSEIVPASSTRRHHYVTYSTPDRYVMERSNMKPSLDRPSSTEGKVVGAPGKGDIATLKLDSLELTTRETKQPSEERATAARSVEADDPPLLDPLLRVSRPISACQRCRLAYIKCDGKLPACTACVDARQGAICRPMTHDQAYEYREPWSATFTEHSHSMGGFPPKKILKESRLARSPSPDADDFLEFLKSDKAESLRQESEQSESQSADMDVVDRLVSLWTTVKL